MMALGSTIAPPIVMQDIIIVLGTQLLVVVLEYISLDLAFAMHRKIMFPKDATGLEHLIVLA
jgi:hypothetical protein